MSEMKKTFAAVTAIGVVLSAGGCSSESAGPSAEEVRAQQCAGFAELTPGYLEMQEALDILGDKNATSKERADAMYRSMQLNSDKGRRTKPYDCDVDSKYFAEYIAK